MATSTSAHLEELATDPERVVEVGDLTDEQREALTSGDEDKIRRAIGRDNRAFYAVVPTAPTEE